MWFYVLVNFLLVFKVSLSRELENNTTLVTQCNAEEISCKPIAGVESNRHCVANKKQCDGFVDCKNGEDEEGCSGISCQLNQFRCKDGTKCIDLKLKCNYYKECDDGSDEESCEDCIDGSDEIGCGSCPHNEFLCRMNKKCIPNLKLCDGFEDCKDGEDETESNCPRGEAVYSNECSDWGHCEQRCANTECICSKGFTLVNSSRCVAPLSPALRLLIGYENGIIVMSADGQDLQNIVNETGVTGFDYYIEKNLLFWINADTGKVQSKSLNQHDEGYDLTLPGPWSPVALAIDWIGDKIYVVDSLGQKVDIFNLNGSWHAFILGSNLTNPNDIALDPTSGLMFVADEKYILKASMNGSNVESIVFEDMLRVAGVAADIFAKRIFWSDSVLDSIETVNYDGKNRFTILRNEEFPHPSRLTLFENRIYWTDATKDEIMSVDKFRGNSSAKLIFKQIDYKNFKEIVSIHPSSQPKVKNPCGINNGGCSELCLLTDGVAGELRYSCACHTGWRLAEDMKSCHFIDEFLLYAQDKIIKGTVLEPVSVGFSDALLPFVSNRSRLLALDFDAELEQIYYSDFIHDTIYRVHRNGTGKEVVLASGHRIYGLTFDWVSKNLYYIERLNGTLHVLSTRNFSYRKIILTGLSHPQVIVVHPNKGYIYFLEWYPMQISRVNSDGSGLLVFKNDRLRSPCGLSIDFQEDRVYWCDSSLHHVKHSNLDGKDIRTFSINIHPFSIAIYKEWMYSVDANSGTIIRLKKLTGEHAAVLVHHPRIENFYGMKVYTLNNQLIDPKHPCSKNNGECEKLCFSILHAYNGQLLVKCGCSEGESLREDGRTCKSLGVISNPENNIESCQKWLEFRCGNGVCMPKTWICDGEFDCPDNSDEENCLSETCEENEFQCKSGECIRKTSYCDKKYDCSDLSDENECPKNCTISEFPCKNGIECIPKTFLCDSKLDCSDGSDENDVCTVPDKHFTCVNGRYYIPMSHVCDGENDCSDGEDERGCPPLKCRANEFKCIDERKCINVLYKCNGITDCKDDSDELSCPTTMKENNERTSSSSSEVGTSINVYILVLFAVLISFTVSAIYIIVRVREKLNAQLQPNSLVSSTEDCVFNEASMELQLIDEKRNLRDETDETAFDFDEIV